jgi:hypothetical protein
MKMWKYFKDEKNRIFAYAAGGSQDNYIKPDLMAITEAEADELRKPPPPTPEEIMKQVVDAIQAHLDAFAQTRDYDGILSAASYANSIIPQFALEGQYALEARDLTWGKAREILVEFERGQRSIPTIEDVMAELPELKWPG